MISIPINGYGGVCLKNEEISLMTKKVLASSLKELMRHKPFSKITVKEIIQNCGVNRNTFYYHFDDIYSLLRWMLTEEAINIVRQFNLLVDYEDAIRFIMNYIDKNDYIINCAYDAIGRDEMKRFFYSDFIDIISTIINEADKTRERHLDPEFKNFLANFYTEALAGTLLDWAKEKNGRNKEKTILYLKTIPQNCLSHFDTN